MPERGLQFRPGPRGIAGASLLTAGCIAVAAAAVTAATAEGGSDEREVALFVAAFFTLGSVFGLASLWELARRRPMPRRVPTVVGLGLAAILAVGAAAPPGGALGAAPLQRVAMGVVSLALAGYVWRLWRQP